MNFRLNNLHNKTKIFIFEVSEIIIRNNNNNKKNILVSFLKKILKLFVIFKHIFSTISKNINCTSRKKMTEKKFKHLSDMTLSM